MPHIGVVAKMMKSVWGWLENFGAMSAAHECGYLGCPGCGHGLTV